MDKAFINERIIQQTDYIHKLIWFSDHLSMDRKEEIYRSANGQLKYFLEKRNQLKPCGGGEATAHKQMSQDQLNEAQGLNFGQAISAMKAGKAVARKGWNGKGLFVFMQVPAVIGTEIIPKMQSLPDSVKSIFASRGKEISYSNQMALVDTENNISGWAPSASDTLAEDWNIIN
jgi:uncharacterized protein (DUF1919 family)